MVKFLFLLRDHRHKPPGPERSLLGTGMNGLSHWLSELALSGNFLWGEMLGRSVSVVASANDLHKTHREGTVVGCLLIQAENEDQAEAIARDCPVLLMGHLEIEVRPVIESL